MAKNYWCGCGSRFKTYQGLASHRQKSFYSEDNLENGIALQVTVFIVFFILVSLITAASNDFISFLKYNLLMCLIFSVGVSFFSLIGSSCLTSYGNIWKGYALITTLLASIVLFAFTKVIMPWWVLLIFGLAFMEIIYIKYVKRNDKRFDGKNWKEKTEKAKAWAFIWAIPLVIILNDMYNLFLVIVKYWQNITIWIWDAFVWIVNALGWLFKGLLWFFVNAFPVIIVIAIALGILYGFYRLWIWLNGYKFRGKK